MSAATERQSLRGAALDATLDALDLLAITANNARRYVFERWVRPAEVDAK